MIIGFCAVILMSLEIGLYWVFSIKVYKLIFRWVPSTSWLASCWRRPLRGKVARCWMCLLKYNRIACWFSHFRALVNNRVLFLSWSSNLSWSTDDLVAQIWEESWVIVWETLERSWQSMCCSVIFDNMYVYVYYMGEFHIILSD